MDGFSPQPAPNSLRLIGAERALPRPPSWKLGAWRLAIDFLTLDEYLASKPAGAQLSACGRGYLVPRLE